jgi:hypothetical protein
MYPETPWTEEIEDACEELIAEVQCHNKDNGCFRVECGRLTYLVTVECIEVRYQ